MYKIKSVFRSICLCSFILAIAGCGNNSEEKTVAQAVPVVVAPVEEAEVPIEASFSATLAAKETVEVRAKISGYITERPFKEGAVVQEGEVLYRLDDRDLKAALDTAKANAAKAKSVWENEERTAQRYIPLAKSGAVSIQERDVVVSRAEEALAQYKAAQADEEKAQVNLGYATITAPISGYVTRSNVEVGSYVAAGTQLLTTVYKIDPILAEFSITDKDYMNALAAAHAAGDKPREVTFRLELGDERYPYPYPGTLEMADPVVGSNTNTIGVRAQFPNPNKKLRPGLYVNVIGQSGIRHALTVPDVAVMDYGGGKAVFTVNAESKLVAVPVEIGGLVGERRIINSGLNKDDKVVVEGLVTAQPGMKVTIVDAPNSHSGATENATESAQPSASESSATTTPDENE
ncbi:MAG: efflux RND transporter periplasmic adaptor subunit [Desulfovibrionaceae bacterium]|nr:efflux RND transporter periplasmic adaptor subunit [Desulfovibrionaceae bacterium]